MPLEIIVKFGTYFLMGAIVLAALASVTLPNVFHAALALAGALIGVAGIYFALRADFLAVVQILIYVGAVMTLMIFAIMLTRGISDKATRALNRLALPGAAAAGAVLAVLIPLILKTPWKIQIAPDTHVTPAALGTALMTDFVFPFEVISIFLLAVLIGAIVIAKKETPE